MRFLKKHRFKIVISVLVAILIVVSFYMLWVHVPYAANQNRLTNIRNRIVEKNEYQYDGYFNEYVGNDTYYIMKVKDKKDTHYAVFDSNKEYIKSYVGMVAKEEDVKNAFIEKYKVQPKEIEIAYENEIFVYCVTYKGEGSLIYAFYGLDTGEFIKAYQLGGQDD